MVAEKRENSERTTNRTIQTNEHKKQWCHKNYFYSSPTRYTFRSCFATLTAGSVMCKFSAASSVSSWSLEWPSVRKMATTGTLLFCRPCRWIITVASCNPAAEFVPRTHNKAAATGVTGDGLGSSLKLSKTVAYQTHTLTASVRLLY